MVLSLMILAIALALPVQTIERSSAAVREFKRDRLCPATNAFSQKCPGYVVDHVWPLACGGFDHESNMQYQTLADGKAKDRWEIRACRRSTGDVD